MKTIKKIFAIVFVLASILLKTSIVSAQCYPINYPIGTNLHSEVQAPSGIVAIMGGTGTCGVAGAILTGMGVDMTTPNYMLDILCNPGSGTNMDINVSSLAAIGIPVNAAGYRIGGNQVLYTGGDSTSIFVGAQAPVSAAYFLT